MPVAPALGYCDDAAVNGAPFYVMGFVDGHVLRDRAASEATLDPAGRRHAGESLVDTLAAIHAVDLEAVGLADLGKHDGYIARQMKRWYGQWNAQRTRDLPLVDEVHDVLVERIPEQGPATPRPRRLPAGQLHGRRRRQRGRRARLGDLHARRPPRRRRHAAGVLDRTERQRVRHGRVRPPAHPASSTAPSSPRATPPRAAATWTSWPSTPRSPTGSWPASWRASTPATSAARSACAARPSWPRSSSRSTPPRRRRARSWTVGDGRLRAPRAGTRARPADAGVHARRVDRRQWRSGRRAATRWSRRATCVRWPRSTATRSSTTAPGARRWSCATASTPSSSGRTS